MHKTPSAIIHLCIFIILTKGISCFNAPPSLSSSKHWRVFDDDDLGTIVSVLRARDLEKNPVTFSLESQQEDQDVHTYFRLDAKQRVVIAKPLTALARSSGPANYIIRVRMDDGGSIKPVTEIRLEVLKSPTGVEEGKEAFKSTPPSFFSTSFPSEAHRNAANGELPTNALGPFPQPRKPEMRMATQAWSVYTDAPVGTVVQDIDVMGAPGVDYNLSLVDSKGLLRVDKSGKVTVNASLSDKIGILNMKVRLASGSTIDQKLVTLAILTRPTHPPPPPPSPSTPSPYPTTAPSIVPNPSSAPTSKEGGLGNNSQDFRVFKNSSNGTPGIRDGSVVVTTEDPKEVPEADISLTIIPIVLVAGISPMVLALYCYWRRIRRRKARAEAKESAVVYTEKADEAIATQVTPRWGISTSNQANRTKTRRAFAAVFHQRAPSNKYEDDLNAGEGKKKRKMSEISAPLRDNWEFPRHHLKFLGILGEGCFGQVWKCDARELNPKGPMLVAVKTLKELAGERERKDLDQELKVLKNLGKHINVVSLLGCCTEKDPIFIILEYMIGGKLQSYLRASRADASYNNLHGESSSLTPRDLTHFTYQIARGMEFLARNGIIHRDLAARNVLVGEEKICKVADFGFARDVANNRIYERKSDGRLPIRWMAPESLFDNIFTTKSDVWSFGVLLWEIVTLGSTPYAGFGAAEVMKKVKDGYRLEKPDHCRREVYNIMYYCWDKNPNERPSFTELVHTLESLLLSEVEYIELDRFPDHSYYNVITEKNDELL